MHKLLSLDQAQVHSPMIDSLGWIDQASIPRTTRKL
jgi:hypothetical protein